MIERHDKPSTRRSRPGAAGQRRNARLAGAQKAPAPGDPGIRDAVRDQHGAPWIRYGTATRSVWFAAADLIGAGTLVFTLLARVGPPLLTETSKSDLKRRIEAHPISRETLVAARPGWLDQHPVFAFGDGTVIRPKGDTREIIVAFEPSPKFSPRATLAAWQAGIGPFVQRQPLPYLAVALALVGPLLHFLERGQLNPIVELVGGRETGKSTVGVLAASVWAGDPNSDVGGGESWEMTINAIDGLKLAYRDAFLFLDEANLVGVPGSKLPEFLQDAIFKLSSNRGKRRMGDQGAPENANVATLSTTNTPLRELVGGSPARRAALESRVITLTLPLDHLNGVFDAVPDGYCSPREAAEALQKAADACWGSPARAFVGKLVRRADRDEECLRRNIAKRIACYIRKLPDCSGSARVQKTLALAAAAAGLARDWGVFPTKWGSPTKMIGAVAELAGESRTSAPIPAIERVRAYFEDYRPHLVDIDEMKGPMSKVDFEACPGFLSVKQPQTKLFIPAELFRNKFTDHKAIISELSKINLVQTENGKHRKLTIKSPKAICLNGRVHCIILYQNNSV